jgi:hypothetical protein
MGLLLTLSFGLLNPLSEHGAAVDVPDPVAKMHEMDPGKAGNVDDPTRLARLWLPDLTDS